MTYRTRNLVNATTALLLVLLSAMVALAQMPMPSEPQAVVNAATSARIDATNVKADMLTQRVAAIEQIKPDVIVSRLSALEDKFNDQQKLLWGIIVAVVVNLLTGSGRFPLRRRRDPDAEPDVLDVMQP